MTTTVWVYTEQDVSPRFLEVIRNIKSDFNIKASIMPISPVDANRLHPTVPVVVFGKVTDPEYKHTNNIFTYSVPQALTKANAPTVIGTALRRAAGELPDVPPVPRNGIYAIYIDDPKYVWDDSFKLLHEELELVCDIEVSGNIVTGTPEDRDVRLLTVAFYAPQAGRSVVFQGDWYADNPYDALHVISMLWVFFCSYKGKLIWHNGKFDVRVLNRILGEYDSIRVPVHEDTMLMHHVLNQAAGNHKLKDLCKLYFNAPEWESDLKKYTKGGGHYENIPVDTLVDYNALDVYWTWVLYDYLREQIDADEHAQRAYELEIAASEFLLRVEERGIPIDEEAADALGTECGFIMEREVDIMRQLAFDDSFNPNSPQQVKRVLAEMGENVEGTSVQILEEKRAVLDDSEKPALFIDSLLAYRKAAKISSTYVKGWTSKMRDGLVHPTFLIHGTSTGRLSSSSPNAQNVPRNKKVRAIVGV